ncbi:methyltransferase domain-containing protein [Streptomyces lunaelactis]|nr:methyltransferase domain-containing protein [Streptomyces lunaelactis]NUL08268.1 methyltransferase domain-containing protein [Streptomyces lunaelactis]NUL22470.1 methyltransferase domain-containing protein [Streptomyces lunaelactis]
MERRGAWPARSAWIREAVDALPRDLFAPDRLWRWNGKTYAPVDRETDAGQWAAEVYGDPDAAAVTQVTDGRASSSLSCQAVVVDMLESLHLETGQRVLELGTGTGWNAALLARRAGPGQVTSVEVDPELAAGARQSLQSAGAHVAVTVGDGTAGWPPSAPYDRVISTYAVDRIPWAWVAQMRPGGRIVTPWGRLGHVALTVADDGQSATGWVQGLAQFMPTRGTDTGLDDFSQVCGDGPAADEHPWERELAPLRDDWHLRFALRVALPDVRITVAADEDGLNARLHDGTASWAALSALPDGKTPPGHHAQQDHLRPGRHGRELAGRPAGGPQCPVLLKGGADEPGRQGPPEGSGCRASRRTATRARDVGRPPALGAGGASKPRISS